MLFLKRLFRNIIQLIKLCILFVKTKIFIGIYYVLKSIYFLKPFIAYFYYTNLLFITLICMYFLMFVLEIETLIGKIIILLRPFVYKLKKFIKKIIDEIKKYF
jgi:hypothetical protein